MTQQWERNYQVLRFAVRLSHSGVLGFSLLIKPCSVAILLKAIEQYFHVVPILLQSVLLDSSLVKKLLNSTFMWCCLVCDTVWF